ncbi:MAG: DNA topoisomerase VI subunit B [Candidatus Altiarchaeota archaeon]|nr:DNA topoisomerase VI subunit B [Candidatus Altiarchaeota archaeon]
MAEEETAVKEKHADELFKEFREVSVTEFFRKNRSHLGYSGQLRSLTTVVHELVTNSLDACEEAGILPELHFEIRQLGTEHYKFKARDNGPGIPVNHIPKVFGTMLAGTKFHRHIQLRGQQGIGVSGVTLFSQMTTGQPITVRTCTGDNKVNEVKLLVDVTKNNAEIVETKQYSGYWRGTEVEGELKGVAYNTSERGPYEYLRRTAIANPYTEITFTDPEGRKTVFKRSSNKVPKPPMEMKPHPKGLAVDDLLNFAKAAEARHVGSFLSSTFARVSSAKVNELQKLVTFDLNKNPRKLAWAEAEELIKAFDKMDFMAPSSEGLRPIGETQIKNAVLSILKPEFEVVITRPPKVFSGGVPFQIEVAVAYGGNAGRPATGEQEEGVTSKAEIMRFANSTPLLFDASGCALTKSVNAVEWKRYGIKDFDNSPLTIFVNLLSMYVPYVSAGKQSVAEEEEIIKEIKMALMEAGRKFQIYHSRMRREIEKEAKMNTLLKYITELAPALSKLTGKDEKKILKDLTHLVKEKLRIEALEEELEDDGGEEEADTTFKEEGE